MKPAKNSTRGRPSDSKTEAYMRALLDVLDIQTWKSIVRQAVTDATDVEDPINRDRARRWLKEVVIGRPSQAPTLPSDEIDLDMSTISTEELEKRIEEGEKDIEKLTRATTAGAVESFLNDDDEE